MAKKSIAQRIELEGADEIKRSLRELGEAGKRAFQEIADAANRVTGAGSNIEKIGKTGADSLNQISTAATTTTETSRRLGAEFLNNVVRLKTIRTEAENLGTSLVKLGGALRETSTRFGILLGSAGAISVAMIKLTTDFARATREANRSAQEAGLTAQEWQGLAFAAGQSEVNTNEFQSAMGRLNKQLEELRTGTATASNGLAGLNLDLTGLNDGSLNAGGVLLQLADIFSGMDDGVQKSALAIKIFGQTAGPQLIPFLNKGRAGIKALTSEAERLGITFTDTQIKLGTKLSASISRLTATFTALRNSIGEAFAPDVTRGADFLTELLVDFRDEIIALANIIRVVVVTTLQTLVQVIAPIFNGIIAGLDLVANAINAVFGTELNGRILLLSLSLLRFLSVFRLLGAFLPTITTLFRLLISVFGGWPVLIATIAVAIIGLIASNTEAISALIEGWTAFWNQLSADAEATWDFIASLVTNFIGFFVGSFNNAVEWVQNAFTSLGEWIAGILSGVLGWLNKILDFAKKVLDVIRRVAGVSGGSGGGSAGEFAGGGYVRGPGTPTSDSIPAWLSDKEFVVRARAVRHYGRSFMEAINSLRFDPEKFSRFASGGLVRAPSPSLASLPARSFANGGPVSRGSTFTLNIGGESFEGLMAPEEVADRLATYSRNRAIRSAGRKPSWYGGK